LRGGEKAPEAGLGRLTERITFNLFADDRRDMRRQRHRRRQTRRLHTEKIHDTADAMIGGTRNAKIRSRFSRAHDLRANS
jgi:hypothetical protein